MSDQGGREAAVDPNFVETIEILNELGIPYWICHGTLLGLVRDGRLIPWDHDIDLAVWEWDVERPYVTRVLTDAGYVVKDIDTEGSLHFNKPGGRGVDLNFYRVLSRDEDSKRELAGVLWKVGARSRLIRLVKNISERRTYDGPFSRLVDVLRRIRFAFLPTYWSLDKHDLSFRRIGYSTPRAMLDTFEFVEFSGVRCRTPKEAERILAYVYGDDWRTPKVEYDWTEDSASVVSHLEGAGLEVGSEHAPIVSEPLVSIIMNCYNGEKYLRDALDSVVGQTYANWELIFWDNQSTDRSAEILKSYEDPRIKYWRAPMHTLLYEARNYAIERSNGEFIAFLDVDDWWTPEKLTRQMPLFADDQVGLVCSNYWIVNEVRGTRKLFMKKGLPNGWVLNDLLAKYAVGVLTLMVRRTAFEGLVGGCNPAYHIIGDFDLVVRLAIDWKMASDQEPLAFYRLHGANEGLKERTRAYHEYAAWAEEHGTDVRIGALPAFANVLNEVCYQEGLVHLRAGEIDQVHRVVRRLPWGLLKLKLLIQWRFPWLVPVLRR